jgi:hypothetical protein
MSANDEAKIQDLMASTIRQGCEIGDGKRFALLVKTSAGWCFVMHQSMTPDDLNDALDDAFKHPVMRVAKFPEPPERGQA